MHTYNPALAILPEISLGLYYLCGRAWLHSPVHEVTRCEFHVTAWGKYTRVRSSFWHLGENSLWNARLVCSCRPWRM